MEYVRNFCVVAYASEYGLQLS